MKMLGILTLLLSSATFAFGGIGVPEVSAGSATSAVALLSGALLVLRGRRKK
jgi:hypothetical protein